MSSGFRYIQYKNNADENSGDEKPLGSVLASTEIGEISATLNRQCVSRRKLVMKGFLKIHSILPSSNGDFVYPAG